MVEWDRVIFENRYGVVYGIRKYDSYTDLRTEKLKTVRKEATTKKMAEKPKSALERAKEKI